MDFDEHFPEGPATPLNLAYGSIRDFDLLFTSGSSFFSKLIQKATGSPWSHVGFLIKTPWPELILVMESVESIGIRIQPLSLYVRDYPGGVVVARHSELSGCTLDQQRAGVQLAASLVGTKYDTAELGRIAARIVGNTPAEHKDDGVFICSEFAEFVFRSLPINFTKDHRGFVAPANLAEDASVGLTHILKGKS
jgi:hypothetical protein